MRKLIAGEKQRSAAGPEEADPHTPRVHELLRKPSPYPGRTTSLGAGFGRPLTIEMGQSRRTGGPWRASRLLSRGTPPPPPQLLGGGFRCGSTSRSSPQTLRGYERYCAFPSQSGTGPGPGRPSPEEDTQERESTLPWRSEGSRLGARFAPAPAPESQRPIPRVTPQKHKEGALIEGKRGKTVKRQRRKERWPLIRNS